MKKNKLLLFLVFPTFAFSQSVIGNVNSGAVSDNNFAHSVGEIYVIPTDENNTNSGTMGMLYQTVIQVLGVSDAIENSYKIYPNPTSDFIFVELQSKTKIQQAEIYDFSGKLVLKAKVNDNKLDLRNLPVGNYILRFENNDLKPIKIIKKP